MLNDEDAVVARTDTLTVPLERLSVGELEARVAALRAEIVRVEAEIARKAGHRSAADALFRTG